MEGRKDCETSADEGRDSGSTRLGQAHVRPDKPLPALPVNLPEAPAEERTDRR